MTLERAGAVRRVGGWLRRPWVVGALVVVCAGAAVTVWLRDDDMRGPYGRFPEPVAQRPPAGAARLVATSENDALVYGGLAITTGSKDKGVYAVGIATGRVYWHYDAPTAPLAIDRATAGVIVKADESDRLTEIGVRSGRIRWSISPPDLGTIAQILDPETSTRNLVLLGHDGIAGIDRATGKTRWKTRWPVHTNCSEFLLHDPVVVGRTAVLNCNDHVRGYDIATGRQWITPAAQLFQPPTGMKLSLFRLAGHGNQDQLALIGSYQESGTHHFEGSQHVALLDPATGKARVQRVAKPEGERIFRDGIQIGNCILGEKEGVCGSDPNTGRRLWGTPLPRGLGFSASLSMTSKTHAVTKDHRLYVLADRNSGTDERETGIVVVDCRTGRLLGTWRLPPDFRSLGGLKPVADGVITIHGNNGDYLYAESPGITSPRALLGP